MRRLILSAGMQRSGSTWLFNALRLIMLRAGVKDVGSGWVGDYQTFEHHDTVIVKLHSFDAGAVNAASLVVYSYRDVRDAVASLKRAFNEEPHVDVARALIRQDREWRRHASFVMRYEDLIESPEPIVAALAAHVGVEGVDTGELAAELAGLSYQASRARHGVYDLDNLLHPGHVTDGRHGSWGDALSPELVHEIEQSCAGWLSENGYQ